MTTTARTAIAARRAGAAGHAIDAFAAAGAILLALPVVALAGRAMIGGALAREIGLRPVVDALALSLVTTTASLVVTIMLGLPLAILLARRRLRGASLVQSLVDLPIVLPPAVAGLALLLLLGRRGILGGALDAVGVQVPFSTLAVVVAQTFVSAPFFIRSARAGLAGVERDLEDAARVDGASELEVLRAVTLPLARPALAAGLVMSWARALGEFGATIMFAGNVPGRTQTLPLLVYGEFQGGDLDGSIAAATILALAALGVLIAVRTTGWGRALDVTAVA